MRIGEIYEIQIENLWKKSFPSKESHVVGRCTGGYPVKGRFESWICKTNWWPTAHGWSPASHLLRPFPPTSLSVCQPSHAVYRYGALLIRPSSRCPHLPGSILPQRMQLPESKIASSGPVVGVSCNLFVSHGFLVSWPRSLGSEKNLSGAPSWSSRWYLPICLVVEAARTIGNWTGFLIPNQWKIENHWNHQSAIFVSAGWKHRGRLRGSMYTQFGWFPPKSCPSQACL